MKPRVLVTGADGFVGRHLIPLLLERGYTVRAMVRRKQALLHAPWADRVEICEGDVLKPSTLENACRGMDVAFYLVHLMGVGKGHAQAEAQGAQNFARAAAQVGVQRIIYLGGLVPQGETPVALHLRSRLETGRILREGPVPVTELRSAIILGQGSLSFEMIRGLVDTLPILPLPPWARNRTQPVDIDIVLAALLAVLECADTAGETYEIGCSDALSYAEVLRAYAQVRGKRPAIFFLPFPLPLGLLARFTALLSGVPLPVTQALIEGLRNETYIRSRPFHPALSELPRISCVASIKKALQHTHPRFLWRFWESNEAAVRSLHTQGMFLRSECFRSISEKAFSEVLLRLCAQGWAVEAEEANLRRLVKDTSLGRWWWEWKITNRDSSLLVRQSLFFYPRSGLGWLLWPALSALLWRRTSAFCEK
ncbi:MAG: NAD(P)H-binding protein [Anaerolineales bacterium]